MSLIHPELSYEVLGAAIAVHQELGPGLLESIYHGALERELTHRGLQFESHVPVKARYKDIEFDQAYEVDLVVEGLILLELKSVAKLLRVHEAQLLTYMKLLDVSVGYLLNFNVCNLSRDGRRRLVRS